LALIAVFVYFWGRSVFRPHRPLHALDPIGLLGAVGPLGPSLLHALGSLGPVLRALAARRVEAERMGDLAPALAGGALIQHAAGARLELLGRGDWLMPCFSSDACGERERVVDVAEAHLLRGRIDRSDGVAARQLDGAAVAQTAHERSGIVGRARELGIALDELLRVLRRPVKAISASVASAPMMMVRCLAWCPPWPRILRRALLRSYGTRGTVAWRRQRLEEGAQILGFLRGLGEEA
jgi:hypothetical protein